MWGGTRVYRINGDYDWYLKFAERVYATSYCSTDRQDPLVKEGQLVQLASTIDKSGTTTDMGATLTGDDSIELYNTDDGKHTGFDVNLSWNFTINGAEWFKGECVLLTMVTEFSTSTNIDFVDVKVDLADVLDAATFIGGGPWHSAADDYSYRISLMAIGYLKHVLRDLVKLKIFLQVRHRERPNDQYDNVTFNTDATFSLATDLFKYQLLSSVDAEDYHSVDGHKRLYEQMLSRYPRATIVSSGGESDSSDFELV